MESAKSSRILLLIFSIASSTTPELAQRPVEQNGIRLETSVSKDKVKGGDTLTYSIELTWPGKDDRFLIEEIEFGSLQGLTIMGSQSRISFYQTDSLEYARKLYSFTLIADTIGPGLVDSFQINYYDTRTDQAGSFTTKSFEIEIKPQKKPVFGRFLWFLASAGILLVLGYIFSIYRRIKGPPGKSQVSPTLEERMLDKLSALDMGREKFALELRNIVIKYLELKLNQRLTGRATSEKLANLDSLTAERKQLIKSILEECDRLTFSPGLIDPILADNLKDQVKRLLEPEKRWMVE